MQQKQQQQQKYIQSQKQKSQIQIQPEQNLSENENLFKIRKQQQIIHVHKGGFYQLPSLSCYYLQSRVQLVYSKVQNIHSEAIVVVRSHNSQQLYPFNYIHAHTVNYNIKQAQIDKMMVIPSQIIQYKWIVVLQNTMFYENQKQQKQKIEKLIEQSGCHQETYKKESFKVKTMIEELINFCINKSITSIVIPYLTYDLHSNYIKVMLKTLKFLLQIVQLQKLPNNLIKITWLMNTQERYITFQHDFLNLIINESI